MWFQQKQAAEVTVKRIIDAIEAMKQYADKADAYIREHAIVLSSWFQKITIK